MTASLCTQVKKGQEGKERVEREQEEKEGVIRGQSGAISVDSSTHGKIRSRVVTKQGKALREER
jgi:hypothetical protein